MNIKFKKRDFWLAILAGELVAWLAFPTLKNLKLLDLLIKHSISLASFLIFWAFFVPAGAIFGLWIFYFIARRTNRIGFFQMGKYGVVGVLNTLLNAGVFNSLIFLTNKASGLSLDIFLAVGFIITVTNSYFLNKFWAFETIATIGGEATKFFIVSTVVGLINITILHLVVNIIGTPSGIDPKIWANFGLAVTIITAFFGNFFGYKFLVFKK